MAEFDTVKPVRNVFVNKDHLTSISFNFAATGSQICDMGAYQHNQLLQVNSGYSNLTVTVSCDGENFYTGPSLSANGITVMNPAVRYIKITATGAAQGLITATLY